MEWFSGPINVAIQETQRYGKTFIVFIEGDDAGSQEMLNCWNDPQVISACGKDRCVAVKLASTSEEGVMFSKCYPVICVPSTFIINGGIPTDIIAGSISAEELVQRLTNGIQSAPTLDADSTSATSQDSAAVEQTQSASFSPSVSNQDVLSTETAGPSAASASDADDFQSRVDQAKEIIRQRQEQKIVEEQNEMKAKELKRRQEGNELSLARRQQADAKAKKLADDLAKKKAEERAAREAVREQIKRDRADRATKYQTEKTNTNLAAQQKQKERQERLQQSSVPPVDMSQARLQFRLPDGSAVNKEFSSDDRLSVAFDFITEHCAGRFSPVRIVSVHPRREFKEEDCQQTLQQLGLAPSAAIIVLPGKKSTAGTSSALSAVVDFAKLLLMPLMMLLTWIMSILGLRQSSNQPSQQQQQQQQAGNQEQTTARSDAGSVRRRTKEGNIHRLHDNDNDNDENKKTWNGNSTQQM